MTQNGAWEVAYLRKSFVAHEQAPRLAREALSFVARDLPEETVQTARLLVSELVTNSVRHGPSSSEATVGLSIHVDRNVIRVDVSDRSPNGAQPKPPSELGGYGLTIVAELASRWGSRRDGVLNVTWFELGLPAPGA